MVGGAGDQMLLAQQLPKFTGDSVGDEDEGMTEWSERLKLVGIACGWTEQVNNNWQKLSPNMRGNSSLLSQWIQEPKRLFYKTYPTTQQGSPEVDTMGRSVLYSQFIAGLSANLKAKVAGVEGDFEELLMKA